MVSTGGTARSLLDRQRAKLLEMPCLHRDDGKAVYSKTGEVLDSPRKAFDVMSKDCITRGASIATNAVAKARSLEEIREFLGKTLLKQ